MPKIIPPEKVESIKRRILAGGANVAEIAVAEGVGGTLIRKLAVELGVPLPPRGGKFGEKEKPKETSDGSASPLSSASSASPSSSASSSDASGPRPTQAGPGLALRDLVAAHPRPPVLLGGVGSGGPSVAPGQPALPPPAQEAPAPPLDAKALLAIVYSTKATVVSNVAMLYRVELTEEQAERLCSFTTQEKEALSALAPHAALYTGGLSKYAGGALAVLFAAMIGASTYRSVAEIKKLRPAKPDPRKIPKKEKAEK